MDWALKNIPALIPWYIFSHPKPRIFVLEATKIIHRYLYIEFTKMR
jgi:hypothetical protein